MGRSLLVLASMISVVLGAAAACSAKSDHPPVLSECRSSASSCGGEPGSGGVSSGSDGGAAPSADDGGVGAFDESGTFDFDASFGGID